MTNTIALKHEQGVSFGTVDWLQTDKLQCQVAARIPKGSEVETRMELAGWKHTEPDENGRTATSSPPGNRV